MIRTNIFRSVSLPGETNYAAENDDVDENTSLKPESENRVFVFLILCYTHSLDYVLNKESNFQEQFRKARG